MFFKKVLQWKNSPYYIYSNKSINAGSLVFSNQDNLVINELNRMEIKLYEEAVKLFNFNLKNYCGIDSAVEEFKVANVEGALRLKYTLKGRACLRNVGLIKERY